MHMARLGLLTNQAVWICDDYKISFYFVSEGSVDVRGGTSGGLRHCLCWGMSGTHQPRYLSENNWHKIPMAWGGDVHAGCIVGVLFRRCILLPRYHSLHPAPMCWVVDPDSLVGSVWEGKDRTCAGTGCVWLFLPAPKSRRISSVSKSSIKRAYVQIFRVTKIL